MALLSTWFLPISMKSPAGLISSSLTRYLKSLSRGTCQVALAIAYHNCIVNINLTYSPLPVKFCQNLYTPSLLPKNFLLFHLECLQSFNFWYFNKKSVRQTMFLC